MSRNDKGFCRLIEKVGAKFLFVKGRYAWWNDGKELIVYPYIDSKISDALVLVYDISNIHMDSSLKIEMNGELSYSEGVEVRKAPPLTQEELMKVGIWDVNDNSLRFFGISDSENNEKPLDVVKVDVPSMLGHLSKVRDSKAVVVMNPLEETVQIARGKGEYLTVPEMALECDTTNESELNFNYKSVLSYLETAQELGQETIYLGRYNEFTKWKIGDVTSILMEASM
ncbi:hypothetical protein bcgnr5372_34660 [Bacillus luti]|nr:hypothetical protein [Bacillus cereus]HDR8330156.1 hypothetical protein [Bacillus cereus]HDR8332966.1 hypothetical protein [Bacillus cereus]